MQLLLLPFVLLYVLIVGQNWAVYAAAIMIAAIIKDMRTKHTTVSYARTPEGAPTARHTSTQHQPTAARHITH